MDYFLNNDYTQFLYDFKSELGINMLFDLLLF